MLFEDRKDAGRALAQTLAALPDLKQAVVLALPRGGVPVAYEVAAAHHLPLDILMVRKLGVPGQEELAMGAIASDGATVFNAHVIQALHISEEILHAAAVRERLRMEQDERAYRGGLPPVEFAGCTVVLIDDGLATGATMRAAVRAVRPRAQKIVVAVPVAAPGSIRELQREADQVFCTAAPEPFDAVGRFYADFAPTGDDEVRTLLLQARRNLEPQPAALSREDRGED